jgi:hypothetical protein
MPDTGMVADDLIEKFLVIFQVNITWHTDHAHCSLANINELRMLQVTPAPCTLHHAPCNL